MTKVKHAGVNILEVWDFRLSVGSPILYDTGEFWRVVVNANDGSGVLDEHTTKVKTTGNPYDAEGVAACYDWLRTVRGKYSRDHIDLRKPVCLMINVANAEAARINDGANQALQDGDITAYNQKLGELQRHTKATNESIKKATAAFHARVAKGGAA